jgi:hypothetical protein
MDYFGSGQRPKAKSYEQRTEIPVQLDAKNFSTSCKVACLLAQNPSCDLPEYEVPLQPSHGDLR